MFTKLCKDMDSNHERLLFQTSVQWLSKINMLSRIYEIKGELQLFFNSRGKLDLFLFIELFIEFLIKELHLALANFRDKFSKR